MKTLIEKLFVHLEFISSPSASWFTNTPSKVKTKKTNSSILSPECFNVRGMSFKKEIHPRRSPMP